MRGQALFEVTHNAARPFIVKAGKGEIRALGTAFDVDLTRREVIVTVTKGVVRVTAPRVGSGEAQSATLKWASSFPIPIGGRTGPGPLSPRRIGSISPAPCRGSGG